MFKDHDVFLGAWGRRSRSRRRWAGRAMASWSPAQGLDVSKCWCWLPGIIPEIHERSMEDTIWLLLCSYLVMKTAWKGDWQQGQLVSAHYDYSSSAGESNWIDSSLPIATLSTSKASSSQICAQAVLAKGGIACRQWITGAKNWRLSPVSAD